MLVDPPEDWAALVEAMLDGPPIVWDESTRYAGGLMIDTFHGLPRVHHGGSFVGFRLEWDDEVRLLGGTLDAGRAKRMRLKRRGDDDSGEPAVRD